ncbi:MAG: porin [Prolixibacteraceae bacterium]|nr:porin [Prolixibacteraceae bacterium]
MIKKGLFAFVFCAFVTLFVSGQTTDDVLNVLVQKNLIAQKEADSLRAEAAIAAQANLAKIKSYPVTSTKKISLAGYTQVRYQALEETVKVDGFDIRRARVDLKGTISPYWSYRLQFDLAGSPKLLDAYTEFKLNDYFNFTIGQAKVPFSLENLASSTKLELIDRSQVVEALTARGKDVGGNQNGRDIGIQLGGNIFKINDRPVVDYHLGVFNGAGINVADNNENKDLAARVGVHPVAGLDINAALYNGTRFVPEVKTGTVVTSPSKNVARDRFGLDLSYSLKNFSLRSEFISGKDDQTKREGYYVVGGYYFFQKKLQVVAKYDFYDADRSKDNDASTWYVLGANLNFNANTKLQVNYTIKQEEGTAIDNNFANVQLQIGF